MRTATSARTALDSLTQPAEMPSAHIRSLSPFRSFAVTNYLKPTSYSTLRNAGAFTTVATSLAGGSGLMTFRRVAVHELGHALGLTHEDGVPAIMTPTQTTGNTIIAPTADDIAGVAALYQAGLRPRAPTLTKPAHWASEVSLNPSLAWNPESGATSYDVYFGTHINPPFVGNTSDHYYSPGPLISNETYFWYVAARNSFGPTPSEFWRSFTTIEPVDETARTRHVFPQFADGQGWLSLVVTTNASLEDAECTISSYGVDINRFIELPDLDKGITSATYPVSSFRRHLRPCNNRHGFATNRIYNSQLYAAGHGSSVVPVKNLQCDNGICNRLLVTTWHLVHDVFAAESRSQIAARCRNRK